MGTALLSPRADDRTGHCHDFPGIREKKALVGRPSSSLKVLLAHRPCDFRDEVGQLLVDAGYKVKAAGNSHETLICLSREREPKPDVLVIEQDLPGMKGTETIKTAHRVADLGGLRIVMLSDAQIDERLLQDLKVGDFLKKPVKPIEVLRAIQRLDKNTV